MWKLRKKQSSDGNNALPTRFTKPRVQRVPRENPIYGSGSFMQRLRSQYTFFAYQQFSKTVLKNPWYRCCLILFTLALLIGSAIQFIFFEDNSSDIGFDVLYIITFCFLAYDTVMRSCVDPTYGFPCAMKSNFHYLKWYEKIGGLLFWCDVVSCITLLLEISTMSFFDASETIEITVNEFGAPESFHGTKNFIYTNRILLLGIIRASRLGKLVDSFSRAKLITFGATYRRILRRITSPCCNCILREEKKSAETIEDAFLIYLKEVNSKRRNRSMCMHQRTSTLGNATNNTELGRSMAQLTLRRVHLTVIVSLLVTAIFTNVETTSSNVLSMVVLNTQTQLPNLNSVLADGLGPINEVMYEFSNCTSNNYTSLPSSASDKKNTLRKKETVEIKVTKTANLTIGDVNCTSDFVGGKFAITKEVEDASKLELLATFFTIFVWIVGANIFSRPVVNLVTIPIKRMIQLLTMLTSDPLGYDTTRSFTRFEDDELRLQRTSRFNRKALAGMETKYLTKTIHRIGSLMKVGFGSAGVEIIKSVLSDESQDKLELSKPGSKVTCIFLFCDIRKFTDATEALQEEVFVFTNTIASVVHSQCFVHGGSPNKNIGDAFLISWPIKVDKHISGGETLNRIKESTELHENSLLSVAKIAMALVDDDFYLAGLSDNARKALTNKLKKGNKPLVNMGFGLNKGIAVQGAIGTDKKIDATYLSVDVTLAEELEGLTKDYGVSILMSNSFYEGLSKNCKEFIRQIHEIDFRGEDDLENEDDGDEERDKFIIKIYTFDMNIDALLPKEDEVPGSKKSRHSRVERSHSMKRRTSMTALRDFRSKNSPDNDVVDTEINETDEINKLPTEPIRYRQEMWRSIPQLKKVREKFDRRFFLDWADGFTCYQEGRWDEAKRKFLALENIYDDQPSGYFLREINSHGCVPPKDFNYGIRKK